MPTPKTLTLAAALALATPWALAFDLQGHRGARGLQPENTLPAFEKALQVGVTTLELDIGVTADGVVVVSHEPAIDPNLARDPAGQWLGARGPLLRSLTVSQVQSYDVGRLKPDTPYARAFVQQQPRDGTRIPRLAEVFDLVKAKGATHVRFNIETKVFPPNPDDTVAPEAMVQALLKVVRDAGMLQRVTLQSFDWRTLKIGQSIEPSLHTVCLNNATSVRDPKWTAGLGIADHGDSVPRLVKAAGCGTWSPNAGTLDEAKVREALALGLQVVPYTVNAPADMDRLIGWGVTGLITDYPDRAREVMARRGLPLPPQVGP